jgi:hypothetical protein
MRNYLKFKSRTFPVHFFRKGEEEKEEGKSRTTGPVSLLGVLKLPSRILDPIACEIPAKYSNGSLFIDTFLSRPMFWRNIRCR